MDRSTFNPQVGDFVRIRDWEDMESEYGLTDDGSIDCKLRFIGAMQNDLHGMEFEIESIHDGMYFGHNTGWKVSKDMLMYADDVKIDSEELSEFLGTMKITN